MRGLGLELSDGAAARLGELSDATAAFPQQIYDVLGTRRTVDRKVACGATITKRLNIDGNALDCVPL